MIANEGPGGPPVPMNGQPMKEAETMTDNPGETVMANCNRCGGDRNSYVRASHVWRHDIHEGMIWWERVWEILECAGCGEIGVRRRQTFSEDEEYDYDKESSYIPETVICWPAKRRHVRPAWQDAIGWQSRLPDSICPVLGEVYVAVDSGLTTLATFGTRTVLDMVMSDKIGDPKKTFQEKLKAMVAQGHMGAYEKDQFSIIVDAGHAAAHRAYVPDEETLGKVLTAVEALLYRLYVLPADAESVKASTPKR